MEINRVLHHIGVKGNEKTNKVAKEMTERTGIGRCTESFELLTDVERTISERK